MWCCNLTALSADLFMATEGTNHVLEEILIISKSDFNHPTSLVSRKHKRSKCCRSTILFSKFLFLFGIVHVT